MLSLGKNLTSKIAQANKDAAEAKLRGESAIAEQEKLRQQDLGLSLKLEQERTARLVIEEKIAPRRLTVEQKANMVRVLSAHRGQKYTIDCARGNSEATNLAWDYGHASTGIVMTYAKAIDEARREAICKLEEFRQSHLPCQIEPQDEKAVQ